MGDSMSIVAFREALLSEDLQPVMTEVRPFSLNEESGAVVHLYGRKPYKAHLVIHCDTRPPKCWKVWLHFEGNVLGPLPEGSESFQWKDYISFLEYIQRIYVQVCVVQDRLNQELLEQ
ncbi:MAG: hypothetical protein CO029_02965 [Candidatus Magasanikbacteria bacterium CG_4_9_14_0_2_um_filter_41_10]|nr:MAG: hypothetical protein AUJ37_02625 [Candidatus Magasanikbacteria bacterium CG1_02_41_34]PJC53399.1 MAG: hypothetical protein CO029_02965 [Candidatus Magasanikbacteria bacterium CG_4_9_14_0_2_um_filter_41_10]